MSLRSRGARIHFAPMSATLSTHVLDTSRGLPAAGVSVALYRLEGEKAVLLARAATDADGRIRDLGGTLPSGPCRLAFEVGAYFAAAGAEGLFTQVTLDVRLGEGHHHVPLLVSPHSAVSYRGS